MRRDIEVWNQFVNLYRNNPEALMIMEKGAQIFRRHPREEDAFLKLIIEVLQQDPERRRSWQKC